MADVFVSYKREDREFAGRLVKALEASGWSVWWDTRIAPGEQWDAAIEREIKQARCVVVVWSPISVDRQRAEFVHIEAHHGRERGILVPCAIGSVAPPFAFTLIQACNLSGWDGTAGKGPINELTAAVSATLERGSNAHLALSPTAAGSSSQATARLPQSRRASEVKGSLGRYRWAACATQGAEPFQEDCLHVWWKPLPPRVVGRNQGLLAVLADGMGYDGSGVIAGKQAGAAFVSSFAQKETLPTDERLTAGLNSANEAISAAKAGDRRLDGMGATILACRLDESGIFSISVGDNTLALWRNGELALINQDHSLAGPLDELARAGKLTKEQALSDPRRHQIRSALTGEEIDLVDVLRRPLELKAGDVIAMGSAGLKSLDYTEVERLIASYRGDGAEVMSQALVRGVESRRAPDQLNATILVIEVS